jgi:hypothetical protein
MSCNAPLHRVGLACVLTSMSFLVADRAAAESGQIYSDANDGFLEVRDTLPPQSPWPVVHGDTFGNWNANVGEWFGPGLTTIVLPFALPNFGAVSDPFLTANFGVQIFEMGSATITPIDLYGVRVDSDPAISPSDWYHGVAPDANATLIQTAFLTPASPVAGSGTPNNFTDAAGDVALTSFLNEAYAGGAHAGQFAFLRLSYASDTLAAGWDAYKITVREAALVGDAPVISFESRVAIIPEPHAIVLCGVLLTALSGYRRRGSL